VGSIGKLVRAMDAHWKWGHACMIPRKLHRGYGCSLDSEAMPGKRDEEHTSVYKQSENTPMWCLFPYDPCACKMNETSFNSHSNYAEDHL
jgi:hypothetical protein